MLIVRSVSPRVVPYYLDGRHPGRWSEAAVRLLGVSAPVEPVALRRVLQGRHPGSGRYLPDHRPRRRRAGWDLVFSAPKSVSLLSAWAPPGDSETVLAAHVSAVGEVMQVVEDRLRLRRGGVDGLPLAADGLVSAAFDHRANVASEPHLHTHLLVANLSRGRGLWGAVSAEHWFVGRRALAALYQLELRQQLARRGWQLEWRLRPDGMADLAAVPREAVRAASSQSRLAGSAGRFTARAQASPQPWEGRVAQVGPRADQGPPARGRGGQAGRGAPSRGLDDPSLERAVSVRLTSRRSDFGTADVVCALAACHPGGAGASEALGWAEAFCAGSHPVRSPTARGRWTTGAARRADDDLASVLRARAWTAGTGRPASGATIGEQLEGGPGTQTQAELVRALTGDGGRVHFLASGAGRSELVAQAEVLAACRTEWEQAGLSAAVSSPSPEGALRWSVLTGIPAYRRGDRTDVLVVDCADRRTTMELIDLASRSHTRLVFVEGGTLPRLTNPASHGLMEVAGGLGRRECPPVSTWVPASPGAEDSGPAVVGRAAAARLLAGWRDDPGDTLLVGLGPEETRALNRAVLGMRESLGLRDGPGAGAAPADGMPRFAAGDRVVVLRRRPGLPPYGSFGTVDAVHPTGQQGVRIAWDGGGDSVIGDARTLGATGYGYAVTPWLAGRAGRPLMVLGPAAALGRARGRAVLETPPPARSPGLERVAGLDTAI